MEFMKDRNGPNRQGNYSPPLIEFGKFANHHKELATMEWHNDRDLANGSIGIDATAGRRDGPTTESLPRRQWLPPYSILPSR